MKHVVLPLLVIFLRAFSLTAQRPNILVITADDMNWNTVSSFGGEQQGVDVTPHIDNLATQGVRFMNGHVAATACMPSRNAINTGRFPRRSGGEGFHDLCFKDIPTIPNVFTKNGYFVGILGKVPHSTPYEGITPWDIDEEMERNTEHFYNRVSTVIDSALNTVGKPFYLIVNSHDPHRPYYKLNSVGTTLDAKRSHPSKIFYPQDVTVPSWLPDHKNVRKELAEYLCSSRRCDDVVGRVLTVLDEQDIANNTIVFFLSDHGMAAPSVKSNIYMHSTRTPMIMRWPTNKDITPGMAVSELTSTLDIFPTILEAANIPSPEGLDGQSLLPLLAGKTQVHRDTIHTTYETTIGKNIYAFRNTQTVDYAYIFNPWHDGRQTYKSSSLGAGFFETMLNVGQTEQWWSDRCEFILRRVPEEFYDLANDPDCLNNLIDDPAYADEISRFKENMEQWMKQSGDPMLIPFQTYQTTKDVTQTYNAFAHAIEDYGYIGHVPNEVDVSASWTIYPPEGTIYAEDFENPVYQYGVIGGVSVTLADNPSKTGINTSDKVLKVTRSEGNAKVAVGTSAVVGEFNAPRYVHMKVLKDRASDTYFQLSLADNSNKVRVKSLSKYDANHLGEWQDLVFDMGMEYQNCGKIWIQVDSSSEPVTTEHNIYIDDILINNDPNSRNEDITSSMDKRISQPDFKIYPVPAKNKLYVDNVDGIESKITIHSLDGRLVSETSVVKASNGIYVGHLENGIYLIRFKYEGTDYASKFIKA